MLTVNLPLSMTLGSVALGSASSPFSDERAMYLPPEDFCTKVAFTTTSKWTLRFYRNGAASLVHAESPDVHQLPEGSFDFATIHREVLRLSQTSVTSGYAFHVHVTEQQNGKGSLFGEDKQNRRAISHAFSSGHTARLKVLFAQALSTPTENRWPELDHYLAEHPVFPV